MSKRPRVTQDKNLRDAYKHYRKEGGKAVLRPEYLRILDQYNLFLREMVIKGHTVKLANFGELSIVGSPIDYNRPDSIDMYATRKLWEECEVCKANKQYIRFENDHTDGMTYRLFWSKQKILSKFKFNYKLIPSRRFKRAISKEVKTNGRVYPEKLTGKRKR